MSEDDELNVVKGRFRSDMDQALAHISAMPEGKMFTKQDMLVVLGHHERTMAQLFDLLEILTNLKREREEDS